MQAAPGRPQDTFGYSGAIPSPVVDLLGASTEQQVRQLAANNGLTGVSWGKHAVNDTQPMSAATSAAVTASSSTEATRIVPIGELLNPEISAITRPVESSPVSEPSISKRLQTLQQLLDQKLIDESEYKQQKLRILKEL
jgi:hypothetical protein